MRLLAAVILGVVSAGAHAGWSIGVDLESFKWEETGDVNVVEKGPRYGLSWGFLQEREAGWQFAYRGQFRRGTVDYTGALLFDPSQAVTARTRYTGLVNEAQGIYRFPQSLGFELLGGLGFDYWERNILPDQREDYAVVFARLGLNIDPRASRGFFGGGGVKLPLYVHENAHLDELGFDRNEPLRPKGQPSLYAQAGYRFTPRWSLIGYYDSYRFAESNTVRATSSAFPGTTFLLSQPASTVRSFGARVQYNFE
jgi:hypothetical protein